MARRSIVLVLVPFLFIPFIMLAMGLCAGCGQKQEAPVTPPAAPLANNTQYPPGYVQQRTARERPMPLNTQTGR